MSKLQIERVFDVMKDGQWRTLEEIAKEAEIKPTTVGSKVRIINLYGSKTVKRHEIVKYYDDAKQVYEFKMIVDLPEIL